MSSFVVFRVGRIRAIPALEPPGGLGCIVVIETAHGGHQLEESELIEQAKRGQVSAYETLMLRYQEIAFRVAYLITGDAADAEDAAQEAFIKAFYALVRFRSGAPFRPWILRIVANEARNRRKAVQRRLNLSVRAAEADPLRGDAPSPEAIVLVDEQRSALLQAIGELRDDDRLVIAYRYFFDLDEAEMAEALGCARGTVKSRLSRALERLRHSLANGGREISDVETGGGPVDG